MAKITELYPVKNVAPNLFVGAPIDYSLLPSSSNWRVIQAAKYPYYEQAIRSKHSTKAEPWNEDLALEVGPCLVLNMVDSHTFKNLPPDIKHAVESIFDIALRYIHANIEDHPIFVHCNWGMSRSPSIALMYLKKYTDFFKNLTAPEAIGCFSEIYTSYSPSTGMREFIEHHWEV